MHNRDIPQLLGYMGANLPDLQTRAVQDRMRNFVNNHAPAEVVERMTTQEPEFKARPTTRPTPKAKQDAAASASQAEPWRLTDDRLAELIASNPRISEERLAELNHLFREGVPDPSELSGGLPDDYGPGHEG